MRAQSVLDKAEAIVKHQYHNPRSDYQADRNFIAEIRSDDLVPTKFIFPSSSHVVPVWVSPQSLTLTSQAVPDQGDGTDIWISIAEVRNVFNIPYGEGQNDEWLACGAIPWSRIECVMPYDGSQVHQQMTPVHRNGWSFNWVANVWREAPRKPIVIQEMYKDEEEEARPPERQAACK
ncbi:hypothetical protein BDV96DRAFT_140312 [Lophiotrema nucula]|uniref:Uncharacterized protein n=1 Tax=Lophiotrema nucula TaxID=690887 RepID=A0A6A5ZV50_9PLEO|nr:hypothetical protein BDV96DRAFT_140312 [Lophiotrema nucula]